MLAREPAGASPGVDADPPMPPPAPRTISQQYAWRLVWSDGWWIAGFVLGILGLVFTLVGAGLTLAVVTAFVGVPFLVVGQPMLGVGAVILIWRHQRAKKVVEVLREGAASTGKITRVEEQYSVRVNGRHPWVIWYQFRAGGQSFEGKTTTLNQPGPEMGAGKLVRVLYKADAPKWSSIYPHP